MPPFFAHSAKEIIPAQFYEKHVSGVLERARGYLDQLVKYYSPIPGKKADFEAFRSVILNAAAFHDLGKLAEENQRVLRGKKRDRLPINHVDAGVSHLLRLCPIAAWIAFSHHVGLPNFSEQKTKLPPEEPWRDPDCSEKTDRELEDYLAKHAEVLTHPDVPQAESFSWSGLKRRLALSCLVDADHTDTAMHYQKEIEKLPIPLRWEERLAVLNQYVKKLPKKNTDSKDQEERDRLRQRIYEACRDAEPSERILTCSSPVGTGKTTAVMAYLLRMAQKYHLRRIFVVLPFTSIISQSVKKYRDAICLPGENPEDVVAENHHMVEFSDFFARQYSSNWRAPIIVTTAVQFFETLASRTPSRLRKLHELPGSAVFIDEAHAAMPLKLWPQQWKWMRELAKQWNCRFVLGSGSLAKIWELPDFVEESESLPDLLPDEIRREAEKQESTRVTFPKRENPWTLKELKKKVWEQSGPRIVILNTVQSAAVVAKCMRKDGKQVFHLSTALAPVDRERIIEEVKKKLDDENDTDWCLVATSCVEAGMDFSFKVAFRESASVMSLLQIAGRANRHGTEKHAMVIDFRLHADGLLRHHPAMKDTQRVLDELFEDGWFDGSNTTDALATEAVKRELERANGQNDQRTKIKEAEGGRNYPEVEKLCRIIDTETCTVIVSAEIIEKLEKYEKVSSLEIQRNSVPLWSDKVDKLGLENLNGFSETQPVFKGDKQYDRDFLGIMHGLLPILEHLHDGSVI